MHIFGVVLLLLAFKDAAHITYNQLYVWLFMGHDLYINELMVKKFSMMGSMAMILVNDPFFKTTIDHTSKCVGSKHCHSTHRSQSYCRALKGLVLTDEPKYRISQRLSVVLLVIRILISTLFLFVGYIAFVCFLLYLINFHLIVMEKSNDN